MHRRGIVTPLLFLVLLAAVDHPAGAREPNVPGGAQDPASGPAFHVVIEAASPRVTAAPASLALTTGWRQRCLLELENRDPEPREIRLDAAPPLDTVMPDSVIRLAPRETRSVRFLLQTLRPGEYQGRLVVRSGSREESATVKVASRPEPAGIAFAAIDHFDMSGPIQAMDRQAAGTKQAPGGNPPPGGMPPPGGKQPPPGGKPPIGVEGLPPKPMGGAPGMPPEGGGKGARGEKDLSHLTVAPNEAIGERVLEAMRPIQELGCQFYRMDVSWRIVENTPGVYAWDRMDWMTRAITSPTGGGTGLIAQIGYQPTWLPADFPRTDQGREAYARWVEAVVTRYADRVDTWEIWNEPLLFWLKVPKPAKGQNAQASQPAAGQDDIAAADVEMILDVMKIASPIIRRLDPGATILAPAMEDFTAIKGPFADFASKVYSQLLRTDLSAYVDGICVHSYPAGFPAPAPRLGDVDAWRRFDRSAEEGLLGWVRRQNVSLPLYSTEFGGFQLPRNAGAEDETGAALALLRNGAVLADHGFRLLTYFELYDWDASSTYLLRSADGHRTRGFLAYQALVASLAGAVPTGGLQLHEVRNADRDHSGVTIKAFRRGPEDIVCVWSNASSARTVRFKGRPGAAPGAAGEPPLWQDLQFAPRGTFLTRRVWEPDGSGAQDVEITVAPLEFHILSRTMSRPGGDRLVPAEVSERDR